MEVDLLEIEGACQARLVALEEYYLAMSKVSAERATPEQMRQNGPHLAKCLDTVREYRYHFDALRRRHANEIESSLAGNPVPIELNHIESVLVDSITELYESTKVIREAGERRRALA